LLNPIASPGIPQGIFKILLIACVVSGANIFAMFGFPDPPQWFNSLTQHKLYSCMMIFFLSNAIEGQLISTGAFEIWFNGWYSADK
jgi:hypothetical protein